MSCLKNDRYLRALRRETVDRTPVWMMRQAGRYLPEYRALRAKSGDFMTLCKTPELACEITLQPLCRFPLDAAILFSDILTIPDAMGLGLHFEPGKGPIFESPLRSEKQILALPRLEIESDLAYVLDAVRLIQRELDGQTPLIGFSGSPWTLATYMVEGSGTKAFNVIKRMMYAQPQTLHLLLERLALAVTDYLNAQIDAGVDSVMIFDTWGGVLTQDTYREFSLNYMQTIVNGLTRERDGRSIPVTLFTKNGAPWLEAIADTGCDGVGLDWTIELDAAKLRIGQRVSLQGNMDPSCLYASPAQIHAEVARILAQFGSGSGHVFNLGHGIHPDVDPENVAIFIDAVHELSKPYHL